MNAKEKKLAQGSMWKLIFTYSIPAIIGMLVNSLYNIIDRVFIGRIPDIGAEAIAGVGVAFPVTNMVLAFALLIGVGAAANISIKLGQRDEEGAERVLGNAFTASLVVSVILTVLGIVFARDLLYFFGCSDNTIGYATEFTQTYLLGTLFVVTGVSMNSAIRGAGNPMASAATQVIGAVINVALDPLFIFTFHLGVKGAALASVTAQLVSCCWVLYYTFSYRSTLRVKKRNLKIQWSILGRIFAIGMSPFALQVAASAVSVVANNTLKLYGGDDAVGAMTIISSVSTLFIMPILGLNQGLQPIIGYNYGAKSYARVKRALFNGVLLATGYVLLCFAAILLFPSNIVEFFIMKDASSMNLIRIATHGIGIFFLALPILGVQIPCSNYFQCVGKAGVSMVISILRQVILLIPLYIIIPQFWGIDGIWYAAPISDFASVFITAAVIYAEMRKLGANNREVVPALELAD